MILRNETPKNRPSKLPQTAKNSPKLYFWFLFITSTKSRLKCKNKRDSFWLKEKNHIIQTSVIVFYQTFAFTYCELTSEPKEKAVESYKVR